MMLFCQHDVQVTKKAEGNKRQKGSVLFQWPSGPDLVFLQTAVAEFV